MPIPPRKVEVYHKGSDRWWTMDQWAAGVFVFKTEVTGLKGGQRRIEPPYSVRITSLKGQVLNTTIPRIHTAWQPINSDPPIFFEGISPGGTPRGLCSAVEEADRQPCGGSNVDENGCSLLNCCWKEDEEAGPQCFRRSGDDRQDTQDQYDSGTGGKGIGLALIVGCLMVAAWVVVAI
mmetsp:Transcript_26591/g.66136  ORF Transcript_26591/g.66136 Transcript_26591/m.66136 type:complete len:178 (-) Transcript_26591:238-771(-)